MQVKVEKTVHGAEATQLLQAAATGRARVEVFVNTHIAPLVGRAVGILREHFVIEQLEPDNRLHELHVDGRVEIQFALEQRGYFQFETIYRGPVGSSSQYRVDVPKEVSSIQRRQAYRVVPERTLPAECVSIGGRKCHEATVVENVSATGIGLSFTQSTAGIQIGKIMPKIQIVLNKTDTLMLDGIIRAKFRGRGGRYFLGLEWQNLTPAQQKTLENYVAKCQRVELQRLR
jgi:c-di-GMP-binding flagellar brake protein YcgR